MDYCINVLAIDYCVSHNVNYGLLYRSVLGMDYSISHSIKYGIWHKHVDYGLLR